MKRAVFTLGICVFMACAYAQRPVRQINPNARVSFANGNAIQVLSSGQSEVFFLVTNQTFNKSMAGESVTESNSRMENVPGVRGFSRGGDGSCKLIVDPARASEILTNIIGFTEPEVNNVFQ